MTGVDTYRKVNGAKIRSIWELFAPKGLWDSAQGFICV
jgi:hypothetical protein